MEATVPASLMDMPTRILIDETEKEVMKMEVPKETTTLILT